LAEEDQSKTEQIEMWKGKLGMTGYILRELKVFRAT
jgi:hypothetical protein